MVVAAPGDVGSCDHGLNAKQQQQQMRGFLQYALRQQFRFPEGSCAQ